MQLCMMLPPRPDRRWALARQMGVRFAIAKLAPELTGGPPPWDLDALAAHRSRFAAAGFELIGLEGDQFDMSRIKEGRPGLEGDLGLYRRMLANMGRLGIGLLCYNFMAGIGWYRTAAALPARGGAHVSGFDLEEARAQGPAPSGPLPAERVWAHYERFLGEVLPAAEAAGVRMGLHPDDPPVPELRGIGRAFASVAGVERALALSASPAHGLTFCQATFKAMGEDPAALARRWAGRIAFVHVRDVRGTAGRFVETFPDEGDTDMAAALRAYRDIGFAGPIRPDHAPAMDGDPVHGGAVAGTNTGYEANGMIFAVGHLTGLMQASGIAWR